MSNKNHSVVVALQVLKRFSSVVLMLLVFTNTSLADCKNTEYGRRECTWSFMYHGVDREKYGNDACAYADNYMYYHSDRSLSAYRGHMREGFDKLTGRDIPPTLGENGAKRLETNIACDGEPFLLSMHDEWGRENMYQPPVVNYSEKECRQGKHVELQNLDMCIDLEQFGSSVCSAFENCRADILANCAESECIPLEIEDSEGDIVHFRSITHTTARVVIRCVPREDEEEDETPPTTNEPDEEVRNVESSNSKPTEEGGNGTRVRRFKDEVNF